MFLLHVVILFIYKFLALSFRNMSSTSCNIDIYEPYLYQLLQLLKNLQVLARMPQIVTLPQRSMFCACSSSLDITIMKKITSCSDKVHFQVSFRNMVGSPIPQISISHTCISYLSITSTVDIHSLFFWLRLQSQKLCRRYSQRQRFMKY